MARSDYFDADGGVSVWLGLHKPEPDDGVDVLRDLCGVESYDPDAQDVVAAGDVPGAAAADLRRPGRGAEQYRAVRLPMDWGQVASRYAAAVALPASVLAVIALRW